MYAYLCMYSSGGEQIRSCYCCVDRECVICDVEVKLHICEVKYDMHSIFSISEFEYMAPFLSL